MCGHDKWPGCDNGCGRVPVNHLSGISAAQHAQSQGVFMGDIGSILLGSVFVGLIWLAAEGVLDFVCMPVFPFYVDELTTVFIRLKGGENLTKPHRRHYYQLLANEKGIAHWKVSVGYRGVSTGCRNQCVVGKAIWALGGFDGAGGVGFVFWVESSRLRVSLKS